MKTCLPRRDFLKTAAALSVSAVAAPHVLAAKSKNKRPNIIFVLADDQTPAYLSCYGGRTPTPNLDRLAREGALCTSAHAVSTLCGPSRYNIRTRKTGKKTSTGT